ncbi:hypothetical protein V8G54_025052 [Vigna mungo]|uniref:Uncharacterized protein n=1 Tax=Vigna mungo TaxID=3915 RepID=A0AAQ3RTZ8_VIGMU
MESTHVSSARIHHPQERSLAQAFSVSCDFPLSQLLKPCIKCNCVSIKITRKEYRKGLLNCQNNLHGSLILAKGIQNLQPALLRLCQWDKDFSPNRLLLTHAQTWVRFFDLSQVYWRP